MKITVFLGGTSSERDVSLASGRRIIAALRAGGHTVTAVDPATGVIAHAEDLGGVKVAPPSPEELAALRARGFAPSLLTLPAVREADVVFLALHGGHGEDGTIQALLDMANVRYTGSGHLASALAMDKDLSKHLFRAAGVQTADWMMLVECGVRSAECGVRSAECGVRSAEQDAASGRPPVAARSGERLRGSLWRPPGSGGRHAADLAERVNDTLGLPVVVKPSKLGSTVGLSLVKRAEELASAVTEAFRHDDEVMIERFVPGRELTVGILGGEALPVGEIIPKHEIYDYECKYTAGMAVEEFPARLEPEVASMLQEQSQRAFDALKLRGCARIDFRLAPDGVGYCLEANTLPGMTELSLIPQGAAAAGIGFVELCDRIVRLALEAPGAAVEHAAGQVGGGASA